MPEVTDFSEVYQEIAREISPETAVQIHKLFKGQQIIFPKKLYNRDYMYHYCSPIRAKFSTTEQTSPISIP